MKTPIDQLIERFKEAVSSLNPERAEAYTTGACVEFASALDRLLSEDGIDHDFALVVAPDEEGNSVAAHVAIRVDDIYFDALGAHDKSTIRAEWASRAPGTEVFGYETEVWHFDSLAGVRKQCSEIGCEFDSDSASGSADAYSIFSVLWSRAATTTPRVTDLHERMGT